MKISFKQNIYNKICKAGCSLCLGVDLHLEALNNFSKQIAWKKRFIKLCSAYFRNFNKVSSKRASGCKISECFL